MKGISLDHIYNLRKKFTILGLTGEAGSGCSEVATCLAKGFGVGEEFEKPINIYKRFKKKPIHNAFRKHRIIYNYSKVNFKPYIEIKYKHVITLFIIEHELKDLTNFINSQTIKTIFNSYSLNHNDLTKTATFNSDFIKEYRNFSEKFNNINVGKIRGNGKWSDFFKFFFNKNFKNFSNKLHENLGKNSFVHDGTYPALNYHKVIQIMSNNLRQSGNPYNSDISVASFDYVFTIVERINELIKCHRKKNNETQIVINSLKNPLEIMFFKQRYSAFYAIAVNKEKLIGEYKPKFNSADEKVINKILSEEYNGGKSQEFYKQKVKECLQLSDIHINYLSKQEAFKKNKDLFDWESDKHVVKERPKSSRYIKNSQPYFSWNDQILKYVSLIDHPGIVDPSPIERCMQLAYTGKHNSGCISRHVGAAITDTDFSIKAIGWNNTPAGQVPCSLRNAGDLVNNSINWDLKAFTNYERENTDFRTVLEKNFNEKVKDNEGLTNGRNICFCFKSLKNSISEGKNQVHTRSLHAEENAFLQLTKYGGTGIKNGILFSTASPCELCSKKAYQLGIRIIYYIDPYPGISQSHILSSGENPIEVRLFNGAIGSAYHQLYQTIMPYKDELALILNHDIKDMASRLQEDLKSKDEEIEELKSTIEKLKSQKAM